MKHMISELRWSWFVQYFAMGLDELNNCHSANMQLLRQISTGCLMSHMRSILSPPSPSIWDSRKGAGTKATVGGLNIRKVAMPDLATQLIHLILLSTAILYSAGKDCIALLVIQILVV